MSAYDPNRNKAEYELQDKIVAEVKRIYDANPHSEDDDYEELPSIPDDIETIIPDVLFQVHTEGAHWSSEFVAAIKASTVLKELAGEGGNVEFDSSDQPFTLYVEYVL